MLCPQGCFGRFSRRWSERLAGFCPVSNRRQLTKSFMRRLGKTSQRRASRLTGWTLALVYMDSSREWHAMGRARDNGRAMPGNYHVGVCHLDSRYCLVTADRFGRTLEACYAGYQCRLERASLAATLALLVVPGKMGLAAVKDWFETDTRRA